MFVENNWNRNGCEITGNDTFDIFHIPIKHLSSFEEAVITRFSVERFC